MQECMVSSSFSQLYSMNSLLIIGGLLVSLAFKQYKHATFCITLFAFYYIAVSLHCHIKALDPSEVYRYLIWSGIDLLFLATLYILARKGYVELFVLVISCALEIVAITCHILRAVDISVTDGAITDYFYSELIMLTNVGFISLALLPPLCAIIKRK